MIEVSKQDLSVQDADLLPTRETLSTHVSVVAINTAVAHGGGHHGRTVANAIQHIVVVSK